MTAIGWAQIALVLAAVLAAALPLSSYIARVLAGERTFLSPVLKPVERVFYKLSGVDPAREQSWFVYAMAMLAFSVVGFLSLYALQRLQNVLPLNPQGFDPVPADLAFNTSMSFITNTNWQNYSGETTMSSSHADARPDGAQFRLRRDRPRHGVRAGAWVCSRGIAYGRQFLGRSYAGDALRVAADLDRRRARARCAGKSADARWFIRSDDARGGQAGRLHWPGGEPGGDQGARHQWRRLFQRQCRASL